MFNKKGSVFGQNSIFVLSSLFGLGLLVLLVINPVMHGYISPSLLATTSGEMNTMLQGKFAFILGFVDLLPYVLFLIGIIYMLTLIFRKERTDMYG